MDTLSKIFSRFRRTPETYTPPGTTRREVEEALRAVDAIYDPPEPHVSVPSTRSSRREDAGG